MKKKAVWLLAFIFLAGSLLMPHSSVHAATKKAKLNVKKLNMTTGNDFRLRVYNLKKKQRVVYTSSNEKVISIGKMASRGKRVTINALSIGSATVNATVKKGKKVVRRLKCRIKVTPNAFSIKFPKRTICLDTNNRFRLKPIIKPNTSMEQPIFESDNPFVASVSSRGVVTAISPGTATITATLLSSGLTATCNIEVQSPSDKNATAKPSHHGKSETTIEKKKVPEE